MPSSKIAARSPIGEAVRRASSNSIHRYIFALVIGRAEERRQVDAESLCMRRQIMCIEGSLARPHLEEPEVVSGARRLAQNLVGLHAGVFGRTFRKRLHDLEQF